MWLGTSNNIETGEMAWGTWFGNSKSVNMSEHVTTSEEHLPRVLIHSSCSLLSTLSREYQRASLWIVHFADRWFIPDLYGCMSFLMSYLVFALAYEAGSTCFLCSTLSPLISMSVLLASLISLLSIFSAMAFLPRWFLRQCSQCGYHCGYQCGSPCG